MSAVGSLFVESSPPSGGGSANGGGAVGVGSVEDSASSWPMQWCLRLDILTIGTNDTANGMQSLRKFVSTCGPIRCTPLQPNVRFDMPGAGLVLRGDMEIRLVATGSMLADERLGWATLHTTFMPHFLLPLLDGGAIPREEMDGIAKDVRFPPDWRMALEYSPAYMDHDMDGRATQGIMDVLPVELRKD